LNYTNKITDEPITYFYKKYGFELNSIKKIITGKTYISVMLKNGNIGVSANLENTKNVATNNLQIIDINNNIHRNILNAYYNALLNTEEESLIKVDIFDYINFSKYSNIIMIGFSEPMYNKLQKFNINISVFDYSSDKKIIKSQSKQKEYLNIADCVILTATSLSNNSFLNISENTNICDIFIFGASTIMHKDMFIYKNIKGLFGTVFNKNDDKLLQLIDKGHGQRDTKNYGHKTAMIKT